MEPDPPPDNPPSDEDAAWREIIANYGEPALPDPSQDERRDKPVVQPVDYSIAADEQQVFLDPEEHFVPPTPPPAPPPRGPRGAAWLGLLGAPAAVMVFILLGITLPSWAAFLLFCAFVGGFGYLVATMRKGDDDPWNDGAVV